MNTVNADPAELQKFSDLAHRWWDPASEFRPLHEINPLRLGWIDGKAALAGKKVLDIGCGGGILAEGMAALGAEVTGIDLSEKALSVARLHLFESGHKVDYRHMSAEALADELKDRNITVNAILPGTIDTPRNRLDMPKADFSRWVAPEKIAKVIAFLASDDASAITGASIPVFGRG